MSQSTRSLAMTMVALLALPSVAAAQDESGPMGAAIREGGCDVAGSVVVPLSSVSREFISDGVATAAASPVGSAAATPIVASVTTIPLSLADIVSADHSIAVLTDESAAATVVACGDIGGRTLDERSLPVGLVAVDGSGIAGMALLEDLDAGGASVSVYLIGQPDAALEAATDVASDVTLNALLHFAGLDITVERAVWDAENGTISVDAVYDNPATGAMNTASIQLSGQPSLVLGDQSVPLRFDVQEEIPGRSAVRAQLQGADFGPETNLADVTLVYGRPDQHQASLMLAEGATGDSQAATDVRIPRKQRKATLKGLARLTIEDATLLAAGCGGRLDALETAPAPSDEMAMVVTVIAAGQAPLGVILQAFMRAPDGTSSVTANGVTGVRRGETLRDLSYCFVVPAPGPGDYVLRFEGGDRKAKVRLVAPAAVEE